MSELCTICNDDTYGFHTTEEHDENWVANSDPCGQCGAEPHQPCRPDCYLVKEAEWLDTPIPFWWCPHCGYYPGFHFAMYPDSNGHNPWCVTQQGGRHDD